MEFYNPDMGAESPDWYKTGRVRTVIAPQTVHLTKLEPKQWMRSAAIRDLAWN